MDVASQMQAMGLEGGVDPVSGNEVPVGATDEEVRDDVDAKLSPGELVFTADEVRYLGLEYLQKLREKAKTGLAKMAEDGQIGGEEMATGGLVSASPTQTRVPVGNYPKPNTNFGTTYVTKQYKNAAGDVIAVPFQNGQPLYPIPAGYEIVTATSDPEFLDPNIPSTTTEGTKVIKEFGDNGGVDNPTEGDKSIGEMSFSEQISGYLDAMALDKTLSSIPGVIGGVVAGQVTGMPVGAMVKGLNKASLAEYGATIGKDVFGGNVSNDAVEAEVRSRADAVAEQLGQPVNSQAVKDEVARGLERDINPMTGMVDMVNADDIGGLEAPDISGPTGTTSADDTGGMDTGDDGNESSGSEAAQGGGGADTAGI